MSTRDIMTAASGSGVTSYEIELFIWGAGGSGGQGGNGGAGGAAYGKLTITNKLYIMVGDYGSIMQGETRSIIYGGGAFDSSNSDGGGGGYSGVFYNSITQANALLIAGGGGGGAYGGYGGAGGGSTGQNGQMDSGWPNYHGTGATQSAGGYWAADSTIGKGSALQAGAYYGTGGGGYYGGGGSRNTGAGGGSGYYNPTYITSATLYSGNLTTPGNSTHPLRGTYGNAGSSNGGLGVKGVVILRYLGSQRGSGGTVSSDAGYTYHTFSTVGSSIYNP